MAVYTDDIEHDVVAWPTRPTRGKEAARRFYQHLTVNVRAEEETPTHRYYTTDAMTLDQQSTAVVAGSFLGLPGNGRRVTVHVEEHRHGFPADHPNHLWDQTFEIRFTQADSQWVKDPTISRAGSRYCRR